MAPVLDAYTLLLVSVADLGILAATLFVVMGRHLSVAAESARRALILRAIGWAAVVVAESWSGDWPGNLLSTLAMASFCAGNWMTFKALKGWLGPRRGEFAVLALAILTPIGYAASFWSHPLRVGWGNFLIAAQLLIVCRAALFSQTGINGRWRWVMSLSMAVMAALSVARGVIGAFFSDVYPHFDASNLFNLGYLFLANGAQIVSSVAILVAWHEEAEQELRDQALIDPLTGVLNRRGWDAAIINVFAHARRHRQPLALLAFDLDHFKHINDTRGHEAGDCALRFFGQWLGKERRSGDIVARVGGEEFYALMPMADEAAARAFDQRLRDVLATWAPARLGHTLDFSSGLARLESGDESFATLAERADRALYRAKAAGRACLVSA